MLALLCSGTHNPSMGDLAMLLVILGVGIAAAITLFNRE